MRLQKKIILASLFGLFFLFLAGSCLASTEVNWPESPLTGISLTGSSEFHEFIAYAYGWGISLGVLFAFIMLVVAGLQYMTSGGDTTKTKDAMGRIRDAALGLALLLSSWLILNTINPQMTTIDSIPNLWEDMDNFEDVVFHNPEAPPCAFALLYIEEDFSGAEHRFDIGSIDPALSRTDSPRQPPQYQTAEGTVFLSGKGFVYIDDLSDHEQEMLEEAQNVDSRALFGDESYDPSANPFFEAEIRDNAVEYPSACVLTVYKKEGLFRTRQGREIGIFPLPSTNFSEQIWEDKEVHSYKLRSASRK